VGKATGLIRLLLKVALSGNVLFWQQQLLQCLHHGDQHTKEPNLFIAYIYHAVASF